MRHEPFPNKHTNRLWIALLFIGAFMPSTLVAAESISETQKHELDFVYPTKFGLVKFVEPNGSLGINARKVLLGNTKLLSANNDANTGQQSLMAADHLFAYGTESESKTKDISGKTITKRIVILEGDDCTRHFIVLDFTGSKPYVSERFGYNPDSKYCLEFDHVKWGKKESYIYLKNGETYIYYTGGKAFGPIN